MNRRHSCARLIILMFRANLTVSQAQQRSDLARMQSLCGRPGDGICSVEAVNQICAGDADFGATPAELCANSCVKELIDCADDPALSAEQQAEVLPVAGICSALNGGTSSSTACDVSILSTGSANGFDWQRVCCKDRLGCANQLPDACGPLCADTFLPW